MRRSLVLACVLTLPVLAPAALGDLTPPQVEVGARYVYETRIADGAPEGPHASFRQESGLGLVMPLPDQQEVWVRERTSCADHTCLVVEAEQQMPKFIPGVDIAPSKKIRAKIDLDTGDVLDVETTLIVGESVSHSTEEKYATESTVAEFYGPWMAHLHDDYEETFRMVTGEVRTYRVKGRESVGDRECFVVHRHRRMPSDQIVDSTLWVDVERRVALRLDKVGRTMEARR